jgi:hypothetical protein
MAAVFGVPDVERIVAFSKKYPVFPCAQDKRPRTKRGFHDASQDPAQVRDWWTRWPDSLVGVPTGQTTGIVAIDYDPDKATSATHSWLAEHTELLTSTRVHSTARGGKHYLFRSTERYQTGTDLVLDGSPRKGLDLRASGGYVIWWPAHLGGGDDTSIAPLPAGLIDERAFDRKRDMAELPRSSPQEWMLERDKVREALTFIEPNGYEHWIRVGMALHHASGGSDEGFSLWHDWSARGESYDGIEDCRYHWASFGGYGGRSLGVGTIYAKAKETGFDTVRATLPPEAFLAPDPAQGNRLLAAGFWASEAQTHTTLPYLVKGIFDRGQIVVLWGPPGSGKTFAALSLAAHIGAGKAWVGRRVKRGKVLYICAESTRKRLENRVRALMDAQPELAGSEVMFVPIGLDLLHGDQDIVAVLAACEQMQDVALIVIDTLAVTFGGGDENSPEDMGGYVSNVKLIKDRTGAAVIIVHHCGKDEARGMRGHSSLLGAIDGELAVERPDPKQPRIMKAGKLREGESFCDLFTFNLEIRELGMDEDGDQVTTCYVSPVAVGAVLRRPSTKAQLGLLKVLEERREAGDVAWTEKEIRVLAEPLMHRNSVRTAVMGLNESGWLKAAVGGWMLTQEAQP